MLDIGNLTGEIDSLSISDEVKDLLEPVLLDGEINATIVKLFSEPVIIDGIINAQINYATGASFDQGGGAGGGEGGAAPGGGQQAPNIGNFNPQTPGEQPQQGGFNLNPQGGLVANRNAWRRRRRRERYSSDFPCLTTQRYHSSSGYTERDTSVTKRVLSVKCRIL